MCVCMFVCVRVGLGCKVETISGNSVMQSLSARVGIWIYGFDLRPSDRHTAGASSSTLQEVNVVYCQYTVVVVHEVVVVVYCHYTAVTILLRPVSLYADWFTGLGQLEGAVTAGSVWRQFAWRVRRELF